jgi:hypothetical protein
VAVIFMQIKFATSRKSAQWRKVAPSLFYLAKEKERVVTQREQGMRKREQKINEVKEKELSGM